LFRAASTSTSTFGLVSSCPRSSHFTHSSRHRALTARSFMSFPARGLPICLSTQTEIGSLSFATRKRSGCMIWRASKNYGRMLVAMLHGTSNLKVLIVFRTIQESDSITSLCLSADGYHALVNLACQEIHLWDLANNTLIRRFTGHKQGRFVIRSCFAGLTLSFVASGSEGISKPGRAVNAFLTVFDPQTEMSTSGTRTTVC
jgi:hypothetical protein